MKEAVLVAAVLLAFKYGYSLMKRLDKFLDESHQAIEKESEKKEPSCVMLTEELSDEEVAAEIRRFRAKHKRTRIMLCDDTDTKSAEGFESHIDQSR